jgi:hypothetical protein
MSARSSHLLSSNQDPSEVQKAVKKTYENMMANKDKVDMSDDTLSYSITSASRPNTTIADQSIIKEDLPTIGVAPLDLQSTSSQHLTVSKDKADALSARSTGSRRPRSSRAKSKKASPKREQIQSEADPISESQQLVDID